MRTNENIPLDNAEVYHKMRRHFLKWSIKTQQTKIDLIRRRHHTKKKVTVRPPSGTKTSSRKRPKSRQGKKIKRVI